MKNKLAHKYTAKCPKCEYASRIPEFEGVILNNKKANYQENKTKSPRKIKFHINQNLIL